MLDVTALGELLIDFTRQDACPDDYPVMAAHPGGAPANFLAALAKFGAKTALLAKVGNDAFGEMLVETLMKSGIETRGIRSDDSVFTTLAFVTTDARGDRRFSFARKPGADMCLAFEELDLHLINEAKIFHFGTLSLTDEPVRSATIQSLAYAKERGKWISFDPNLRLSLWKSPDAAKAQMLYGLDQADVVKISNDEVRFLFGLDAASGAERICREFSVKLVFVTCGAEGCYYRNALAAGFVPALAGIRAVDTTGAGDIFGGVAIWKLLELGKAPEALTDAELQDVVRFANTAAGLSVTKAGGIPSIPEKEEVLSRLCR